MEGGGLAVHVQKYVQISKVTLVVNLDLVCVFMSLAASSVCACRVAVSEISPLNVAEPVKGAEEQPWHVD